MLSHRRASQYLYQKLLSRFIMSVQAQQRFFREIVEQHKGIFYKVARAYCPTEHDRQDLIQEILIQVWRSIDRYDDKFKLSTWLYRISLNVAISFYRKQTAIGSRYSEIDARTEQISDEVRQGNEWQLKRLEQFIDELKEFDKALMLLYLEEKSHAEIAEILGMSVSNVGTKVGRIKKQLKNRFSELKNT